MKGTVLTVAELLKFVEDNNIPKDALIAIGQNKIVNIFLKENLTYTDTSYPTIYLENR